MDTSQNFGTGHIMADCSHLPRLSNLISQRLGVDIVKGLYVAGEVLPTEMALAQHWQISRSVVREGICALVSTGLIERRTKAGTIVSDRSRWNLLDPLILSWMRQGDPDAAFVSALLELTYIIEPQAAALAARRATADDMDELCRLLDIMQSHTRTEEAARRADLQFRAAIVNAAGNQTFIPLLDSIEAAIAWSHTYRAALNIDMRSTADSYVLIIDAIAKGDEAEAKWQMESLIRATMTIVAAQQRPGLSDAPRARSA